MDYSNAFGADFREVQEQTREGEPVRVVVANRTYATDRDDLWNAVTDPERIPRWFLPVSGNLEVGGRYKLEGNAEGSILACAPPDSFEISWEFGGGVSWVRVTLTPDGEGTRLTLAHLHPRDEKSEQHWTQFGPGATGVGWDLGLAGLDLHLANDNAKLDPEEGMAWMTSDPGKIFIRDSAQKWCDAHLVAGEKAEVASAMAKRTADFFTGA